MTAEKLLQILAKTLLETLSEIAGDVGTKKNIPGRLAQIDQAQHLLKETESTLVKVEEKTIREAENARLLRLLRVRKSS